MLPGLAAALLLYFACLLPAHAAGLRAELTPLAPRPRTHAPSWIDVKLHWPGSALLEGVLEITIQSGVEVLLRQRTHELALITGTQSMRLMLPPLPWSATGLPMEAHLRFHTRTEVVDLGNLPIAGASFGAVQFVVATCGSRPTAGQGDLRLWHGLRLERFKPVADANAASAPITSPALIETEDCPATPLGWCAFDMVLLEGDGLSRLREKQLTALARWVDAGGSLCVIAGGPLRDEHLRFLNGLAARPDHAEPFRRDERDHLAATWTGQMRVRSGLGRMVVAAQPPETVAEMEGADWRRTAAFLWNLRDAEIEDASGTVASAAPAKPARQQVPTWRTLNEGPERIRTAAIQAIIHAMLPRSARLIPLPVVGAIVGAFILVVGPGEWFALGWLRRRRWTWITFPIFAAAFTALTVAAAEHYLGSTDHRSVVGITDLARDGRPLRESRLELLFAASDRTADTELRQSFAVPSPYSHRNSYNPYGQEPREAPLYEGQVPARAVLRTHLRQWTPQVNRLFSFDAEAPAFRWPVVTARELGAQGDAARWFAERADAAGFVFHVMRGGSPTHSAPVDGPEFEFLRAISLMPPIGTGGLVARFAPSGSPNLQDLALTASDDQSDWLVFAVKRTPNETRIYRCLYSPE